MFHGAQGRFRWLESLSHGVQDVLRVCPDVVIGKSLAVTAFDAEKLQPISEEALRGWQITGSALMLPPVATLHDLPFDVFDEWYAFPSAIPQANFDSFVRHEWFTLGPASASQMQARSRWHLTRMLRVFWQELETLEAESYVACGNRLIFATSNPLHFSAVLRGLSAPPKTRTGSS